MLSLRLLLEVQALRCLLSLNSKCCKTIFKNRAIQEDLEKLRTAWPIQNARPYCYFATDTISLFLLEWQSLEDYLHNVSSTTFFFLSQGASCERMQNTRSVQQWYSYVYILLLCIYKKLSYCQEPLSKD